MSLASPPRTSSLWVTTYRPTLGQARGFHWDQVQWSPQTRRGVRVVLVSAEASFAADPRCLRVNPRGHLCLGVFYFLTGGCCNEFSCFVHNFIICFWVCLFVCLFMFLCFCLFFLCCLFFVLLWNFAELWPYLKEPRIPDEGLKWPPVHLPILVDVTSQNWGSTRLVSTRLCSSGAPS